MPCGAVYAVCATPLCSILCFADALVPPADICRRFIVPWDNDPRDNSTRHILWFKNILTGSSQSLLAVPAVTDANKLSQTGAIHVCQRQRPSWQQAEGSRRAWPTFP